MHAYGVPGAASNPLCAALYERGTIAYVPAHHLECDARGERTLVLSVSVARKAKAADKLLDRSEWVTHCLECKRTMLRKTSCEAVPMTPQRGRQCMDND